MAEVFEAELAGDHGFSRRVAIKRMSEQVAHDAAAAARFLEEARIASSLHHAGIVAVLDFGVMDGTPFQVLELVDGLNADQLIDRAGGGKLPTDVALAIAADVAHALHHAHEARDAAGTALAIVHRDVKPSNVLLSWAGDIKLSDFGIAFARGRAIQTETGLAPGSWTFMAPEQRTRSAVDRRADVFSLGCTLHALLTGDSPQRDFDVAIALTAGTPLSLAERLDDDVRAILERALRPSPAERYATAGELANALGAALARRLTRDPRSRLQEFLTPLREAPAARGGLLDQLLAVELVLASEHGAVRQFELRSPTRPTLRDEPVGAPSKLDAPEVPPPLLTSPPRPAPPPQALSDATSPTASRARSLRRISVAAALPLALAAVGWRLVGREQPSAAPEVVAPAVQGAGAAADRAQPPVPGESTVRLPDSASADERAGAVRPSAAPASAAPEAVAPSSAAPAAPSSPIAKRPRGEPRHKPAASPTPASPAAPTPAAPAATVSAETAAATAPLGYLKVVARDRGDPRMVNARVYVDGKLRGYSPDPISATVGPHQIRVVLEDDTTEVGTYRLEVKDDHRDRGHPATLQVP